MEKQFLQKKLKHTGFDGVIHYGKNGEKQINLISLLKDYKKQLKLNGVNRSNRKETLKNFQEIEMILKEANEEVDNGIYDPTLEALSSIINKYEIIKK